MLEENKKKSLGRGLEALLGEDILNDDLPTAQPSNYVNIKDIVIGPWQPRKDFNEESIKSLASSIKEKGVLPANGSRKQGVHPFRAEESELIF